MPPITVFMLSLGLNAQKYGWIVALVLVAGVVLLLRWNGAIAAPNASIISSCRCR